MRLRAIMRLSGSISDILRALGTPGWGNISWSDPQISVMQTLGLGIFSMLCGAVWGSVLQARPLLNLEKDSNNLTAPLNNGSSSSLGVGWLTCSTSSYPTQKLRRESCIDALAFIYSHDETLHTYGPRVGALDIDVPLPFRYSSSTSIHASSIRHWSWEKKGKSNTAPSPIGDGLCIFEIIGDREDTVDLATKQALGLAAQHLVLTCLNGGPTGSGGTVSGLGMWESVPNYSGLYALSTARIEPVGDWPRTFQVSMAISGSSWQLTSPDSAAPMLITRVPWIATKYCGRCPQPRNFMYLGIGMIQM